MNFCSSMLFFVLATIKGLFPHRSQAEKFRVKGLGSGAQAVSCFSRAVVLDSAVSTAQHPLRWAHKDPQRTTTILQHSYSNPDTWTCKYRLQQHAAATSPVAPLMTQAYDSQEGHAAYNSTFQFLSVSHRK